MRGTSIDCLDRRSGSAAPQDSHRLSFDQLATGAGDTVVEASATLTAGQPQLFLRPVTNQMELSWPGAFNDWKLQSSATLAPGSWAAVTDPVLLEGGWFYVQRPNAPGREFFRLAKP